MPRTNLPLMAVLAALAATVPALAHHTFTVKYDPSKTVRISGVITSVSYSNPHIYFEVGGWTVEMESPAAATAKGLSKDVLKEGVKATVTGWPARDGSHEMGAATVSVAGGPTVTTRGSAR